MPPPNIVNHEQPAIDRHNEEWRVRVLAQVNALLDDVESRKGFYGAVFIQVNYQGKVSSVDTQVKQTIR